MATGDTDIAREMRLAARENLAAAFPLHERGLLGAAASRFYYAMFQASVHRLTARGWTPGRLSSGAVEWNHTMVANNVLLVRRRRSDRDLIAEVRYMRELADYAEDSVDPADVASHAAAVREFVEETTR